jgi:hypothetical protein
MHDWSHEYGQWCTFQQSLRCFDHTSTSTDWIEIRFNEEVLYRATPDDASSTFTMPGDIINLQCGSDIELKHNDPSAYHYECKIPVDVYSEGNGGGFEVSLIDPQVSYCGSFNIDNQGVCSEPSITTTTAPGGTTTTTIPNGGGEDDPYWQWAALGFAILFIFVLGKGG